MWLRIKMYYLGYCHFIRFQSVTFYLSFFCPCWMSKQKNFSTSLFIFHQKIFSNSTCESVCSFLRKDLIMKSSSIEDISSTWYMILFVWFLDSDKKCRTFLCRQANEDGREWILYKNRVRWWYHSVLQMGIMNQ